MNSSRTPRARSTLILHPMKKSKSQLAIRPVLTPKYHKPISTHQQHQQTQFVNQFLAWSDRRSSAIPVKVLIADKKQTVRLNKPRLKEQTKYMILRQNLSRLQVQPLPLPGEPQLIKMQIKTERPKQSVGVQAQLRANDQPSQTHHQNNDWFYTKLNWRLLQDYHNSSFPFKQSNLLSESEVNYMISLAKHTGQIDEKALQLTFQYLNDQMVVTANKKCQGMTLLYRVQKLYKRKHDAARILSLIIEQGAVTQLVKQFAQEYGDRQFIFKGDDLLLLEGAGRSISQEVRQMVKKEAKRTLTPDN